MRPLAFQLAKSGNLRDAFTFEGKYNEQNQVWIGQKDVKAYFTKCTEATRLGDRPSDTRTYICDLS